MKNLTNEKLITTKEKEICSMLDENNSAAISVVNFLNQYYLLVDLDRKTTYHKVFSQVYLMRTKKPKWELANLCNISESTLFRIRRNIIDCFNFCYYEF